jgi:uncharacterized protein YaeQ
MAQKATIFKATLNVADMDRHYYAEHALTLARHPSETDERLMVRVLAFALNASDSLQFTRGLSTDDEPELWQKSLSDEIELWIEVGQPDESRLRKACNRAARVRVYTYGGRAAALWWEKIQGKLARFNNLEVINLPADSTSALAELANRAMTLQCTVQDGQIGLGDEHQHLIVEPEHYR